MTLYNDVNQKQPKFETFVTLIFKWSSVLNLNNSEALK